MPDGLRPLPLPPGNRRRAKPAAVAPLLRGEDGRRPVLGDDAVRRPAPGLRDFPLFNEYFHGDTGGPSGASHQTGWTGLVALMLQPRTETEACHVPVAPGGGRKAS